MFRCQMCNHTFSSITLYNKHQVFHKNMPDLRITCFFKNCGKQFNKYFNFKKHILRWHTMDNKTYKRNITFNCKERNLYVTNKFTFL